MVNTYLSKEDLCSITLESFIDELPAKRQQEYQDLLSGNENDLAYSDATVFRQGSCELFALALRQEFGYSAYELSEGSSVHYFCKESVDNKLYYVDIRGITTDFNIFNRTSYSSFSRDSSTVCIIEKFSPKEGIHMLGLYFAKWIIAKNRHLYEII